MRVRGREAAIEEILETLAKTNPMRGDILLNSPVLKKLCRDMGVKEASLRSRLRSLVRRRRSGAAVTETTRLPSREFLAQRELLGTVLSDTSLAERFGSIDAIAAASEEELSAVEEIGLILGDKDRILGAVERLENRLIQAGRESV